MSEEEERRDWSELPPDLIHVIAKKLPDLLDFIRFRAVCKRWCSSAPLSDAPHQLPWLIEIFKDLFGNCSLREQQRFYSVSSAEIVTIPFSNRAPSLESWINRGVCAHYLAFAENYGHTVSFYNPLTQDLFSPPPTCLEIYSPSTVWTGTGPIRNRRIMLLNFGALYLDECGGWFLYDPHTNDWVEQEGVSKGTCYWQGMLFCTRADCPTEVFDARSKELLCTIPPPEDDLIQDPDDMDELAWHLRESWLIVCESQGVILRVLWFLRDGTPVEESDFIVYKLDFETADGEPCWVCITDIGDQVIFLEVKNGFCMTARPSSGFRPGCIYFIDPRENQPYVQEYVTGTVERVPCPFERCSWFVPGQVSHSSSSIHVNFF